MNKPSKNLLQEIAMVQYMDATDILVKYKRFFPTMNNTRRVGILRHEVIYKLQEEYYGIKIQSGTAETLNASLEKRNERQASSHELKPGAQFVREYQGERHVIIYRGPKEYEYLGMMYRSPSVIAKRITGTNWNGREFFHLPSLKAMKEGASA